MSGFDQFDAAERQIGKAIKLLAKAQSKLNRSHAPESEAQSIFNTLQGARCILWDLRCELKGMPPHPKPTD